MSPDAAPQDRGPLDAVPVADLLGLVPDHLAAQRWYDGDRAPDEVRVVDAETWDVPADPDDGPVSLRWLLVEAVVDGRTLGRYQLVLGLRPGTDVPAQLHGHDEAVLGAVPLDGPGPSAAVVFDAVLDPRLARAVLGAVAPGATARTSRVPAVEQSNTSIVFDEHLIVKLFRRVHVGTNPDVDAVARLQDAGFAHVPAQRGVLARPAPGADPDDPEHDPGDPGDDRVQHLAVARDFLVGAADGWHVALGSLRILFADHVDASASGGDFGHDAFRLGAITARLHLALADAYGTTDAHVDEWVAGFRAQLDRVRDLAARAGDGPLASLPVAEVSARYDDVAALGRPGPAIRIHGDLHLGQTLRADAGWFVIDFEGEPARPVAERTRPSSPLRDVAGMLRSFHYAAEVAHWEHRGEEDEGVGPAAAEWEARARRRFLDGYVGTEGIGALLPGSDASEALLAAFELDKATYEVAYEVAYRPSWVGIPLGAIRRLLR